MKILGISTAMICSILFFTSCDNTSTTNLTHPQISKKDKPPLESFYGSKAMTENKEVSLDVFEVFPISPSEVFLLGLDEKSKGILYKLNLPTKELIEYDIGAIIREKKGIDVAWLCFARPSN